LEKKNQKTFTSCRPKRVLHDGHRGASGEIKVFWFFSSEKNFLSSSSNRFCMKRLVPATMILLVAASGAAQADTMPQLDFGNKLLTAQVIWGAIIFAVFYGLVSRWGLPKVASILEMRSQTIARDLNQARDARADADRAVAELMEARKKAYAQSQAAIADATQTAKAQAAAKAAEQEAKLDAQLAESEAQIGAARSAAMGALREVATDTAVAVVARLIGGEADTMRVQAAVGQVLADRGLSQAA
jgi:F-type H+-transporting ATPase subunit b